MSSESKSRSRRRLVEQGVPLEVVLHAEARACDDPRRRVMQQPIQEGRRQGAVMVEERGPRLASAVRGEHERPVCIAPPDDVEEEVGASRVNGERASRVEDEQSGRGVLCPFRFETARTLGGFQRVDDLHGTGKEHGGALEAGRRAQRRGQGVVPKPTPPSTMRVAWSWTNWRWQ